MQLNMATFIIIMIYLPLIYQLSTTDETDSLGFTDSCDLGTWVVTAT